MLRRSLAVFFLAAYGGSGIYCAKDTGGRSSVPRGSGARKDAGQEPGWSSREGAWDWDYLTGILGPNLVKIGILRYGLRREDAEDVLHEIFARVLVRKPQTRNAEAYIRTSFYHASIDLVRKRRANVSSEAVEHLLADDPVPRLVAAIAVQSALRNVSAACRELIEAYCLQEQTLAETAAEAGGTVNAVWKRIDRCLNRLLQSLR